MASRSRQPDDDAEYEPELKSFVRELVEVLLICLLAVIFARAFVFLQSDVPSGSMEDTILIGDTILVNRFVFAPVSFEWERKLLPTREIRRGDLVVFKHPPGPERDFVKRVIGLPGERIELHDGRLFVDGRLVEEPYVNDLYRTPGSFGPVFVEAGNYFLMGDHRNRSADSRTWGPVPAELIKGRAFMILFSTGAAPDPSAPQGRVSPKSVGKKLVNLLFRGRWDRALRLLR